MVDVIVQRVCVTLVACGRRLLLMLALAAVASAAPIGLGVVSFDVLIPGGLGAPGVNAFTVSNLTGDPTASGFALPPDFPAITPLTFRSASLKLNGAAGVQTVSLGDLGPGQFSPVSLHFADTLRFSSATFSATLDRQTFQLAGGASFTANSANILAQLVPASGSSLIPGSDFVLITTDNTPTSVPEPASLGFSLLGVTILLASRRGQNSRSST
jgi:hypothetical protein